MAEVNNHINAQIEALKEKYSRALPGRISHLRELWENLNVEDEFGVNLLKLLRAAHTLAGSGATFGHVEVSHAARSIEELLQPAGGSVTYPTGETMEAIEALLGELELASTTKAQQPEYNVQTPPVTATELIRKEVFLIDHDADLARKMVKEIAHAGYSVTLFLAMEKLVERLKSYCPGAIVMDMALLNSYSMSAKTIARMCNSGNPPPVLFLSLNNDLESRLSAVRAGAAAYFPKPVEIGRLIERLDSLTGKSQPTL